MKNVLLSLLSLIVLTLSACGEDVPPIFASMHFQNKSQNTPQSTPKYATVNGTYLFYNNSAFDNRDSAANSADDYAIATDKRALRPGETAAFANLSSYHRGINGIMIDIKGVTTTLTAGDFIFATGNSNDPSAWSYSVPLPSVTVRPGEGKNGADRYTLIWSDNSIVKTWLAIIVPANSTTGLEKDETYFFGNSLGNSGSGDFSLYASVNSADEAAARNNPAGFGNMADVLNPYDYNRDRFVNSTDQIIARNNSCGFPICVKYIVAPNLL